jgi:hypothetical protein
MVEHKHMPELVCKHTWPGKRLQDCCADCRFEWAEEALQVFHETGLTPRQLQSQIDRLTKERDEARREAVIWRDNWFYRVHVEIPKSKPIWQWENKTDDEKS